MSLINYSSREINCKIVYYGPGLCGKTTNLQHIYSRVPQETRGKMISLATEMDRTLFFDFLPLELGQIRGFRTRFHLYTVPGQVYYNASRKLILKGVDGIVFVADSQIDRFEANVEMNPRKAPYFEAVALRGTGVFDTLKVACKLVLKTLG
ncbi:MAG: gliding-motility protein MglA [Candidatus Eisenbacteria bacterium]|uniref:Gliding-motility protein MglA n=1 Tax=Eiseniibacteriota bacterium TaxID=2212470 RepID=A0A538SSF9_UNCEI|nr:MAG: gliding-motility protein MglA [Candidatus Eisenbacteria bacterium]